MERETLTDLIGRFEREHEAMFPQDVLARSRWELRRRREAQPQEPVWGELEEALGRVCTRLGQHADKEQRYVLPYLHALAQAEQGGAQPPGGGWGSVDRMAEAMCAEHEALLAELGRVGALRARCPRVLRERIGAVDAALRARMRFEEERLYPAAMEIEAR